MANKKQGIHCDWLGEHIELSLVGPTLEMEQKLGDLSVIHQVPGHLGPIVSEMMV